ncbi:MAG TPA: TatD family hydrolase [Thermoanaerobaculia bacterium]|nr:TatD family hydrolase [Thermoanaerobaculia bacterium]
MKEVPVEGGAGMSARPRLTDAHAHLGDPVFDADREQVLARAREAGVAAVVVVGETLEDARRNLELAERHPELRPCAGLYPTHLDPAQAEAVIALIRAERERLVAIGEVGLDRWVVKDEEERALQREIFGSFVELSKETGLPLNVHSRSAGHHAISFLLERGAERVLLHAFDGKASKALPGVEAGYFFSVPPSIVRSQQKRKLVERLPLECLLLETDSPVLGPTREERNEPRNLRVSLEAIAEIKGLAEEAVAEATIENARRLFGIE